MHILYFHQHFVTPRGSGGSRSFQMARKLIETGHSVTMVCGSSVGSEIGLTGNYVKGCRRGLVDGIDVIELNLRYANKDGFVKRTMTFLKYAGRSLRLVMTEKCDVVFATTTPLTAGIPGIVARWIKRKPFVFEVRDLWPELPRSMGVITNPVVLTLMSWLEWMSYHSAHRIVGLSPGIVKGIEKRGVSQNKIRLVPNGCDLNIFSNPAESWRPPNVGKDELMAIYTGTHGQANGLDAVIDVARELKSRGRNDIKLVLVGDGKLKNGLVDLATSEQLDNIVFLAPVVKMRIAGLMKSADVGMQLLSNVPAFYYGTSPNKFFDYIASGLPVLNNYPGWLADMITEKECGFAVPPQDPVAFANALENAANDREALKRMGHNAQSLARSEFDRDDLAERWVEWVTGAVNQGTTD